MNSKISNEAVFKMTLSDIRSKLLVDGEPHIIVGWFVDEIFNDKYCAFGGKFIERDHKIIDGSIIDRFGNSEIIKGYMDLETLQFSKYYPNSRWNLKSTFNYKFKLKDGTNEKGNIWVGSYDGQSKDCRAKAVTCVGHYLNNSKIIDEYLEITKF